MREEGTIFECSHSPGQVGLPDWLSCFPDKLRCFASDDAFITGWRTLVSMDREGSFPLGRLWNLGSVLFKSDSLLAGNTRLGMAQLIRAEFAVRAGREIRFNDPQVRALWRYALGRYTDERMAILGRLLCQAPSLYLLVEAHSSHSRLPTAVRLTDFKGEALPSQRKSGSLRAVLAGVQSAMLNFVHTADEPADVVRELGLLFDEAGRRNCLLDVMRGTADEAASVCDRLLASTPHADLDFAEALERVRRSCLDGAMVSRAVRADWLRRLARVELGDPDAWRALASKLSEAGLMIDPLDDVVIDAQNVRLKREWPLQPFPSCERKHWEAYTPASTPGVA